jgi:hypothetical protein
MNLHYICCVLFPPTCTGGHDLDVDSELCVQVRG